MAITAKTLKAANGQTVGFLEYVPAKVDGLIIFLHGNGERKPGTSVAEINNVAINGIPNLINAGKLPYNFIVLCPLLNSQYTKWQNWYVDEMYEYARDVLKFSGNIKALTGLSLGGGGTWQYGCTGKYKDQFSSYAPICGTQEYTDGLLCSMKRFWAFHCMDDDTVPVNNTQHAETWVYECQSKDKKFTYYKSGGHSGAWNNAYDPGHPTQYLSDGSQFVLSPNLYEWFLQTPIEQIPVTMPATNAVLTVSKILDNGAIFSMAGSSGNGGISSGFIDLIKDGNSVRGSWDTGRNDWGNVLPDSKSVTGLLAGTYTATLTIQDKYGLKVKDSKSFTVGSITQPIPDPVVVTPPVKTILSKVLITTFTDGSFDAVKI